MPPWPLTPIPSARRTPHAPAASPLPPLGAPRLEFGRRILAGAAFERAGDPSWYPEAGEPWQPLKYYNRGAAITLPFNTNLILAGVGVSNSALLSDTFNIEGVASAGTEFDSGPYLDVEITTPGGVSNEVQRVGISVPETQAVFTGGTFTLTYNGQTTTALDWDALTSDVQSALEALSNIGTGNVSVTQSQNSLSAQEWTLVFQGALHQGLRLPGPVRAA